MKGKMTTGAGKPSRSDPWKQTPEPPPGSPVTLAGQEGKPPPPPDVSLPPHQMWPPNGRVGWQGPSFREASSSTVPRDFSPVLLGTSAISGKGQKSHSKLRERRRGELAGSERGGDREPGGSTFPVPQGGVFTSL